ncbi:MAG: PorV/PorQ family protein [candidate division WOR-3 bacterium]|nr:PorV/PorQ family protein [candidate division WOR-3 bacterium]
MKKIIFAFLILSALFISADGWQDYFLSKSVNVGFAFLKTYPDAQTQALSGAGTAGYSTPSSFLMNPASPAFNMNKSVSASYMHSLNFLNNSFIHINYPLKYGFVSGGFSFSNSDTLQLRGETPTEEPLGSFNFSSYSLSAGYSIYVTNGIYWGINLRSITEMTYMLTKTSYVMGTGFTFTFPGLKGLSAGFSFTNIGPEYRYDLYSADIIKPPFTVRAGIKQHLNFSDNYSLDIYSDIVKPNDDQYKVILASEFTYNNLFSLSGGYRFNDNTRSYSLGAGFNINYFEVRYSFTPYSYSLGYDNTITLTYKF